MKNSMTLHDWGWFTGIMAAGLARLYWVAKKTTRPEVLWKKPPAWQIILLLALLAFIVTCLSGRIKFKMSHYPTIVNPHQNPWRNRLPAHTF